MSIHWIEAHKGQAGNEKADEMARVAEFRTIMDESIDAPSGYDKQKLWAACYKQWTTEWCGGRSLHGNKDVAKTSNFEQLIIFCQKV